ncbi:3-hydroxymethyl-3-methylglutaryl-CoA lyase [Xylogone sp. PMI_703]|nr:3-hydroxymethyl-3-methylglutaryl-CoA lyase [Xylogone sp. PMI_703]
MSVRIVEVGPRDGLQNVNATVPVETKLELVERLERSGLKTIEITSVVSPKAIPQLSDCRQVLSSPYIQTLKSNSALRLQVLIPNIKGLKIALKHGIKEIGVFISATEGFSKANINCSIDEGIQRARSVATEAKLQGIAVRGYVSCIFADPYDGPTSLSAVHHAVKQLFDMGCYEVSLGDTLGVGTVADVRRLIEYLVHKGIELKHLAGHFHDTYGQALTNVWEAYQCGIRIFDSSVGGLGGCPFAPGAKGNVATEDVVYMFENAGIKTGVDLIKLTETGNWISEKLQKPNSSRAGTALSLKHNFSSATKRSPAAIVKQTRPSWSMVQDETDLYVQRSGANIKIVLNRPRNGNALTLPMITQIKNTFKQFDEDPSVFRIVITANGKFFCTGMDLGKGNTIVGRGGDAGTNMFEKLTELFDTIDNSSKVTIAAINGPAFGGGVGLAFTCDIRICVQSAEFTLSEVKLGICPAVISKYVTREWGIPLSRSAMLKAQPVKALQLKSRGIVDELCEDFEKLENTLENLLTLLRSSSPAGSRMSKQLIRLGWTHAGKSEQADVVSELFARMTQPGSEGEYGVRQFQARKKVDWDSYIRSLSKAKL